MADPRYAPKTLTEVAAEFRAMMEDAIKRNEFEVAATCKTFLKAVESAQAENAKLREGILNLAESWLHRHAQTDDNRNLLDCRDELLRLLK